MKRCMIVPLRQRGAGANRLQCKWGRHCCRPHSHRRVDDPLLVMRPANLPLYVQGSHAWRPMSSLLLPRLATGVARDLSPALAPASGFCSCGPCVCLRAKACRVFAVTPLLGRDQVLYRSGLPRLGACAGSAAFLRGQVSDLSGVIASLPSVRSRLAIGRGLLHAVSIWARGQMSPPSLRSKPPAITKPCGFSFQLFCVPKTS